MYLPPLSPEDEVISTWQHRQSLLRGRIGLIDADIVCFQEVSPLSFEQDFAFMTEDLGYDGVELFRKGRFRPATFWKKDRVELVTPAQHKDRTMLTTFRIIDEHVNTSHGNELAAEEKQSQNTITVDESHVYQLENPPENKKSKANKNKKGGSKETPQNVDYWHVLNCHLQAGKQGGRRVRQIVDGVTAAVKLAKKLEESDPTNIKLVVCGDFNGGSECGAVRYLESGKIGPDFLEDGEQVSSKEKLLPLASPLIDAYSFDRDGGSPPATLVVAELISLLIDQGSIETCYINPLFSEDVMDRFGRIYKSLATVSTAGAPSNEMQMGVADVEAWLTSINKQFGRGSEFRNAAKYMGWVEPTLESEDSGEEACKMNKNTLNKKAERPPIIIPDDGILTFNDFIGVYLDELRQGKFWGIAWDLARLGEPLPIEDVFKGRYDRMYCSASLSPVAVLDTISEVPCPNKSEPSDHLPVASTFQHVVSNQL